MMHSTGYCILYYSLARLQLQGSRLRAMHVHVYSDCSGAVYILPVQAVVIRRPSFAWIIILRTMDGRVIDTCVHSEYVSVHARDS